jgi:hypothetical protein
MILKKEPNKIVDRTTARIGIADIMNITKSATPSSAFFRRWSLTIGRSAAAN